MTTNEADARNPVESLGEEFLERRRRGESVSVNQYMQSHPEFADEIRRLFPTMIALERFKSSAITSSSEPRMTDYDEPPDQLGDFRIVRELGRGGMGVVYEAEQVSLNRFVAVKLFPRKTLTSSKQLARFQREAKTAGRLHHTNIVPVYGVGEQDGLHYFVMQRIDGESLDAVVQGRMQLADLFSASQSRAADRSDSSSESVSTFPTKSVQSSNESDSTSAPLSHSITRLVSRDSSRNQWIDIADIGIQVCAALHYAHSQGVLHRDIKPGNLVMEPNGVVWVTDFGLATVVESEQQSDSAEVAGTLRFMAPEHIAGKQDARSDLYSLGLTLYELMTGRGAFRDASRTKLVANILSGRIPRPRSIRREIPRDLEAIILKSIACDPADRYDNAEQMAADLRRFVQGRPVAARRAGPVYRVTRWAKRNPIVATLTAALLTLAAGSFMMISSKWHDAVVANDRAELNLSLALESMDQILGRFGSNWMAHPVGTSNSAGDDMDEMFEFQLAVSDYNAEVLQDALKFYDRFAEQNPTNPQLNLDIAKVHRRVADIYLRLGQMAKAEQAYMRSLTYLSAVPAPERHSRDYIALILQRAETRNQLGRTLDSSSRFEEASQVHTGTLAILMTAPQTSPEVRAERARTLTNLAHSQSMLFRRDQATTIQRQAVDLLEEIVGQNPTDVDSRLALAQAYRGQAWLLGGRRSDAESRSRQQENCDHAVGILEDLVMEYPTVPDYRYELCDMLISNAELIRGDSDRPHELSRAIEMSQELVAQHPSIPRYRVVLGRSLTSMGRRMRDTDPDEAREILSQAIGVCRPLTVEFADIPVYRVFLVQSLRELARHLQSLDQEVEAGNLYEDAIEQQRVYVRLRPQSRMGRMILGDLYGEYADALRTLGENERAAKAQEEANKLRSRNRFRRSRRS